MNELQITEKMANECAKGGEGRDLDLMLISGSMTLNAVYYESGEEPDAVVIPAKVYAGSTELTVTSIGHYAFAGCPGLTSVTIPEGVTSIGDKAFRSCKSLTSVTIPSSVASIGDYAFYGCSGLTSVTIPSSVASIGASAFEECRGLTSLTISEGVTTIGECAFDFCQGLTAVTIPSSVTTIGDWAFANCRGLTNVNIPSSVTSIGDRAFSWCHGLTSISVESGNSVYDSRNNCNAIIETATNTLIAGCKNTIIPEGVTSISNYAFASSGLTSVTIPMSVTSIGHGAFWGCAGMTSVTIPSGVTSIGEYAFHWCSGLESVTSLIEEPFEISSDVFSNKEVTLYVPAGTKALYEATDGWKNFTNIVEMGPEPYAVLSDDGKTVTFYYDANKVSRGGFYINDNYKDNHPYSAVTTAVFDTSFDSYRPTGTYCWFYKCSSLTSIKGMENLHTDNVNNMLSMFYECSALTILDVSGFKTDNVTCMNHMFFCCSGLTNLDVSGFNTDNVRGMWGMFAGCSGLTTLDLSGFKTHNVTDMAWMFTDCSSLKTIYAGNGWSMANVTEGNDIFTGCTSLVGGKGTAYDELHTDHTYARIDGGTSKPGYFTDKSEQQKELEPVNDGDVDFGGSDSTIDENTDLDGNVVGNIYYNIAPGDGGYNPVEGCIEVTKPTSDEDVEEQEGQDIFGEDFQKHFTGIVFKVPADQGTITINAETVGNIVLKVRIGKQEPFEMILMNKNKIKIPYSVSKPTYVYIYAGEMETDEARGTAKANSNSSSLRIYGLEWALKKKQGDVNGDLVVDVADIASVIDVMAGGSGIANPLQRGADVNGDGTVDVADIATIISIMAGGGSGGEEANKDTTGRRPAAAKPAMLGQQSSILPR